MVCADPTRQHYTEDEQHAQLLDHAFSLNFEGDSVDLFCKSMQEYANAFDPEKYYGKIIAWHGPSGAGKSKGVDALQEKYPVFTICFRSSDNPSHGWPPGDLPAYRYFATCEHRPAEERVAAFLGAFLEIAADTQEGVLPTRSAGEIWRYRFTAGEAYEESARGALFTRVAERAHVLLSQVDVNIKPAGPPPSSLAPTIPGSDVEPEDRYQELWKRFCEAPALALIKKLEGFEYCFIAFDECTELPNVELSALRRILGAGHHIQPLWFILLDTNAKIQSLIPTSSHQKSSARFASLQCLPAWYHFGFGQLSPPEPNTPRECLQVDYLRKIGRPLFATYRTALVTYAIAKRKLFCPRLPFDPESPIHIFTAFSHRILLDLGSTATAHQMAADSVHYNLRYATRMDGEIVHTMCPSEPLLSLISADVLNKNNNFTVACRRRLGSELARKLVGDETAEVNREHYDLDDTFSHRLFNVRLITLAEHLNALVHLDRIDKPDADKLRQFTSDYHVNLTHMVQFREEISAIPQTLLRRLFIRGAAVQCCRSQPVIDGFYVAYGGDLDQPFDLNRFIIVSWKSRARAAAATQGELVASLTGPMQIDSAGRRCKPAQLVIVMDLNAKPAFPAGDAFLQVAERQAKLPAYPEKPQGNQTTTWGGYATTNEEEPKTWCLNIRGHGEDSYPCTAAMDEEWEAPPFSALFDEVRQDIDAYRINAVAARSADACLHPLIDM
ncbi:hypothetical protein C8J57DRAFT_1056173 [Mycena rebaudengoi]|nr:hypothetical protein C8J57DRAFT_1056173 [Mycena rebaudengoi]